MRLAVFTNQFPTQLAPFFARDMRSLLQADVDLEVFPLYPLDPSLWEYVSDLLSDRVLQRERCGTESAQSPRLLIWLSRPGLGLSVSDVTIMSSPTGEAILRAVPIYSTASQTRASP